MGTTDGAPVAENQEAAVSTAPQEPSGIKWESFQTAWNAFWYTPEGNLDPFHSTKVQINEAGVHLGDLLDPSKTGEVVDKLASNPAAMDAVSALIVEQKANLQNAIADEQAKETPDTANIALIQGKIDGLSQMETVVPVFKEMSELAACFVDSADKRQDIADLAKAMINSEGKDFPQEAVEPFLNLAQSGIITPAMIEKLGAGNEKLSALSGALEGINSWESPEARAAAFDLLRNPQNITPDAIKSIIANVEPEKLDQVLNSLEAMGGDIGDKVGAARGLIDVARANPALLDIDFKNMSVEQLLDTLKSVPAEDLPKLAGLISQDQLSTLLDGKVPAEDKALMMDVLGSVPYMEAGAVKGLLNSLRVDESGSISLDKGNVAALMAFNAAYLNPENIKKQYPDKDDAAIEAEVAHRKEMRDEYVERNYGPMAVAFANMADTIDPQFMWVINLIQSFFTPHDDTQQMIAQGAEQGAPTVDGQQAVVDPEHMVPANPAAQQTAAGVNLTAEEQRAEQHDQMAALLNGVDLGFPPGVAGTGVDVNQNDVAAQVGGGIQKGPDVSIPM